MNLKLSLLLSILLFLHNIGNSSCSKGTIEAYSKISDTTASSNFENVLEDNDFFSSASNIGDLDNDGVTDLAVGAYNHNNGSGAIWILFMNENGTVKNKHLISNDSGGDLEGILNSGGFFGISITPIGDINNDGIIDIAAGANHDSDGGSNTGAVWILMLNTDGSVLNSQKISATEGNFNGSIGANDNFGISIASIGDADNDNIEDLAVGAYGDDACWIIYLNNDGTVKDQKRITDNSVNFNNVLNSGSRFGRAIDCLGDLNGDGFNDLVVSAYFDNDGGTEKGALYILFLDENEDVTAYQKISYLEGNFDGMESSTRRFGYGLSSIGDIDNDGFQEILVCSDFNITEGRLWMLSLEQNGSVNSWLEIIDDSNIFTEHSTVNSFWPYTSSMGDMNSDGSIEIAAGMPGSDDGGSNRGAVYIVSLCTGSINISGSINANEVLVSNATVELYDAQSQELIASTITTTGNYNFSVYQQGNYKIIATPTGTEAENFLPTYYGDQLQWSGATSIDVVDDIDDAVINLVEKTYTISGTILANGELVNEATIQLFDANQDQLPLQTLTSTNGTYTFADYTSGSYKIIATPTGTEAENFLPTYYGDQLQWSGATSIDVVDDIDGAIINLVEKTYTISGTILANGELVNEATIQLFDANQDQDQLPLQTLTSTNGTYTFADYTSGSYKIIATPTGTEAENFLPTYYGDQSQWEISTNVELEYDLVDININLIERSYIISGTIYANGNTVNNSSVEIFDADAGIYSAPIETIITTTGEFSFNNYPLGNYIILATPTGTEGEDYLPTYYENSETFEDATSISISSDININFELIRQHYSFSGTVNIETGYIEIYNPETGEILDDYTTPIVSGVFYIASLPKDEYIIGAIPSGDDTLTYQTTYFPHATEKENADVFVVDAEYTNVNFDLVNTLTGINTIATNDTNIKIRSNPVNEILEFSSMFEYNNAVIEIYDINANLIISINQSISTNQLISIPVNSLANGVYSLHIRSDNGILNIKFIK